MRSGAIAAGIPITTTVAGAAAALEGIRDQMEFGRFEVCSLQEYHRHLHRERNYWSSNQDGPDFLARSVFFVFLSFREKTRSNSIITLVNWRSWVLLWDCERTGNINVWRESILICFFVKSIWFYNLHFWKRFQYFFFIVTGNSFQKFFRDCKWNWFFDSIPGMDVKIEH